MIFGCSFFDPIRLRFCPLESFAVTSLAPSVIHAFYTPPCVIPSRLANGSEISGMERTASLIAPRYLVSRKKKKKKKTTKTHCIVHFYCVWPCSEQFRQFIATTWYKNFYISIFVYTRTYL